MRFFGTALAVAVFLVSGCLHLVAEAQLEDEGKLFRHDASLHPLARCLDGSIGGLYFQNATSDADKRKWLIFLEDGAECVNEESCGQLARTEQGSSAYWPLTRTFAQLLDPSPDTNPYFHSWNRLLIPSCSGDLFLGTHDMPPAGSALQFSGLHHVRASIDFALRELGLAQSSHVVLSGAGKGAIGVSALAEDIQSSILIAHSSAALQPRPRLLRVIPSAAVAAPPAFFLVTIGGLYSLSPMTYNGTSPERAPHVPFGAANLALYLDMWRAFLPLTCRNWFPADPARCALPAANLDYVDMPVFAVQAQTDATQLMRHSGLPGLWRWPGRRCLNTVEACPPDAASFLMQWTNAMLQTMRPFLMRTRSVFDGGFFPSCLLGTAFTPLAPTIDGRGYLEAVANWVDANATGEHVSYDSCNSLFCGHCNG